MKVLDRNFFQKYGAVCFYIGAILIICMMFFSDKFLNFSSPPENNTFLVNQEDIYLTVGQQKQIDNIKFSEKKDSDVKYIVDNPNICDVTNDGKIIAKQAGKTTITIKQNNGKGKTNITIHVNENHVVLSKIEQSQDFTYLNLDSFYQLKTSVYPVNATNVSLKYIVENPEVIQVDNFGKVTPLRKGVTKVYTVANDSEYQKVQTMIQQQKTDIENYVTTSPLVSQMKIEVISSDNTVNISSLSVKVSKDTLNIGEQVEIISEIKPSNATNKNIIYNSSDTNVAKVSSDGIITAVGVGNATITAISSDGLKKDNITIKVIEPKEIISLSPKSVSLNEGDTYQINYFSNIDSKKTFNSSDKSVATVDSNGVVRAAGAGKTMITIAGKEAKESLEVTVLKRNIPLEDFIVDTENITLNKGEEKKLNISLKPQNANITRIEYQSSVPSIVSVTETGVVKAKKGGQSVITIKVTTPNTVKIKKVTVTSIEKVKSLTPSTGKIEMMVGESIDLKIHVSPSSASNKRLRFKSNNPKVASITETGKIVGEASGSTTIIVTARDGSNNTIGIPIRITSKNQTTTEDVEKNYSQVEQLRPRIGATPLDFNRVKTSQNPYILSGKKYIIDKANSYLNEGNVQEAMVNNTSRAYRNGVNVENNYIDYFSTLGFAYKITGNVSYANAVKQELLNLSKFKTGWQLSDHLATASVLMGSSIGFDWIYDVLSTDERQQIASAIYHFGIKKDYENYDKNTTNWNTVIFSAVGVGATAIYDEPIYQNSDFNQKKGTLKKCAKQCSQAIVDSVKALQSSFHAVEEYRDVLNYQGKTERKAVISGIGLDGSDSEGLGYWTYAMEYYIKLLQSMQNTFSNTYGLMDKESFKNSSDYPIYMTGRGVYNYADAMAGIPALTDSVIWMANQYDKPELYWYYNTYLTNTYNPFSILWYEPILSSKANNTTSLDKFFVNGSEDVAVLRGQTNITDKNTPQTYVGFKGGYNRTNHGDLDVGSFVMDAMGVRFIYDVGRGDYNSKNYFTRDERAVPNRFMYYPKRAEGNNTIVINPESTKTTIDQEIYGMGKFLKTGSTEDEGYAVLDMTDVYRKKNVVSVRRGVKLFDKRTRFVVVDEIKTKNDSVVDWNVNVPSQVKIWYAPSDSITLAYPDGKNSSGKTKYKTMNLNIACEGAGCEGLKFEVVPQQSTVNTLKNAPYNYLLDNYKGQKLRIRIHTKANSLFRLNVYFTPIYDSTYLTKDVSTVQSLDSF